MMRFREIKSNLEKILSDSSQSRFTVIGHQQQAVGASEILGNNRRVQVFFSSGNFDKGKSGQTGNIIHEVTFRVELSVSAATEGDLTIINDPNSTSAQVATAIADFTTASYNADYSLDEFFELTYQILMDTINMDLGTDGPPYYVANRWVSSMEKGEAMPHGEYVIMTGSISFSCQVIETTEGFYGLPAGTGAFNSTVDLVGDDNEKTGVIV